MVLKNRNIQKSVFAPNFEFNPILTGFLSDQIGAQFLIEPAGWSNC